MNKAPFLLIPLAALVGYGLFGRGEIRHAPGVLVREDPEQVILDVKDRAPWELNGYQITPLAEFRIKARVLSVAGYSSGRESEISPLDLALGWGPMSDQRILDQMIITQSGRWYHWRASRMPTEAGVINSHSANMHMIPADQKLAARLNELRPGHIVELTGSLVSVKGKDGWNWTSSLDREDTGNRACELVWVKNVTYK